MGTYYFTSSDIVLNLGFDAFDYIIIAEFFNAKEAYNHERQLILENWKNPLLLNGNIGGYKFNTIGISIKWTEERKRTHSLRMRGKKRKPLSDESKTKISEKLKGHKLWQDKKHSEETKNKLSIVAQNRSKETIDKMINSLKKFYREIGVSQETKDKISKANSGKVRSEETRMKMSIHQIGKPKSESHRQNIKEAQLSTYVLEDIDGNIETIRCNFRKYCKDKNLNERLMLRSFITGEYNNNWRLISSTKFDKTKKSPI